MLCRGSAIALEERLVRRHPLHRTGDIAPYALERLAQLLSAHQLAHAMVGARLEALAEHDLDPGIDAGQIVRILPGQRIVAEQVYPPGERFRNFHLAAAPPERAVVAFG